MAQMTARTLCVSALILAAGLSGCDNRNSETTPSTPTGTRNDPVTPPAPDNTARNERDRDTTAPTPMDQGETEADRTITAEVRRAIMATEGMSTNAQNCKIITKAGVVTLRGPVATQAERDSIEAKAKAVAGVTSVINELEVGGR